MTDIVTFFDLHKNLKFILLLNPHSYTLPFIFSSLLRLKPQTSVIVPLRKTELI